MARPAPKYELDHEDVQLDPTAVERAYRLERARRRARERHKVETSRARVRFYAVMLLLFAGTIALLVLVWNEIQHLFGL
ncbi:MAG: hypothetical protein ABR569_03505 [Gaiellaceae bacterium]